MLDDLTPRKAIEFAVATEQMGERAYKKLAEKFAQNAELKELFESLAEDEQGHASQFRSLLDFVPADDDILSDQEKSRYLSAMATSKYFRGEGGLAGSLEDVTTVEDALVRVFGFEKATLSFYLAVRDVLGQNPVLDALIAVERGHVSRLMKYILSNEKMKGLADRS
jgi:rubrerythrin